MLALRLVPPCNLAMRPRNPKWPYPPKVLRDARLTCGYTQMQAAMLADVHHVEISRWENGGPPPRRETQARYLRVVKLFVPDFKCGGWARASRKSA